MVVKLSGWPEKFASGFSKGGLHAFVFGFKQRGSRARLPLARALAHAGQRRSGDLQSVALRSLRVHPAEYMPDGAVLAGRVERLQHDEEGLAAVRVKQVLQEVGCDSGSGDRVGCFQSRVVGVGPQLGFIIPLSTTIQGYLNLKSYWEFANQNRPDGWNTWVTFVISPAEQTPSAPPRRMVTK
jgi:hypothetical protein